MGSERLPGKVLAPLAGQPLLALLAERLHAARVDGWWLATSSDSADDVLAALGEQLGWRVFRGDEADVLSRFLWIGAETGAEWVVRVTADNPFLDAPLVNALLDARDGSAEARAADAIHHQARHLPLGYGAELVRSAALERADRGIIVGESYHRVHVTSWLAGNASVQAALPPAAWPKRPDWRWTIDTEDDLAMAESAFGLFGERAATIDYAEMVRELDAHPEITGRNQHIEQKQMEEG